MASLQSYVKATSIRQQTKAYALRKSRAAVLKVQTNTMFLLILN